MHVLRPLFFVLAVAVIVVAIRVVLVPDDFGIHENGYMYGWYRKANIEDWKAVTVKYQGSESCRVCHGEQDKKIQASGHRIIGCENCHGPALGHPSNPQKLFIDGSRELCLRCHTYLAYPTSNRAEIKGIDPDKHNPGLGCARCHKPHEASRPG